MEKCIGDPARARAVLGTPNDAEWVQPAKGIRFFDPFACAGGLRKRGVKSPENWGIKGKTGEQIGEQNALSKSRT